MNKNAFAGLKRPLSARQLPRLSLRMADLSLYPSLSLSPSPSLSLPLSPSLSLSLSLSLTRTLVLPAAGTRPLAFADTNRALFQFVKGLRV